MLKSRTGTDRSDQTTTWARMAVIEALLTENRVVTPFGSLHGETSKYGSSSVAAGTSSIVQISAEAEPANPSRHSRARQQAVRFIATLLLSILKRPTPKTTASYHNPVNSVHGAGTKWSAVQALSSWMASKPTANRPSAVITTVTQAWAAAGSSGGFGLPATVVFRLA